MGDDAADMLDEQTSKAVFDQYQWPLKSLLLMLNIGTASSGLVANGLYLHPVYIGLRRLRTA